MHRRGMTKRAFLKIGGAATLGAAMSPFIRKRALAQSRTNFDYYVSTTGKDSNAGTLSSPWAITSFQDTNANQMKMPGKRIGLVAGSYNIAAMKSGSQPGDYQHPVLRVPSGTSAASTYVGSSNTAGAYTPLAAVVVYGAEAGVNPMIGQNPSDTGYWTLDGVELNGNGYRGALIDLGYLGGGYTSAGNTPGVVIQNSHLHGIAGSPAGDNEALIFCSGTSGTIIQNNVLHDAHKPAQPDHCHAYLEYGCQGTQITNNTIYDCDTGLDAKAGNSGTVVAYNYFYNCPTSAIQGMDGAEGNPNTPGTAYSVHHNVIDSCGPAHACDVNLTANQGLNWYNNTVYNVQVGSAGAVDQRAAASNLIASYNNIVVLTANTGGPYTGSVALSMGGFTICDYNCYFFNSNKAGWGLDGKTTYDSLTQWQAAPGTPDVHSITANPKFVSTITPGAGPEQFKLANGSPCVGTGKAAATMGAWDGSAAQIGANLLTSMSSTPNDAGVSTGDGGGKSDGGSADAAGGGDASSTHAHGGGCAVARTSTPRAATVPVVLLGALAWGFRLRARRTT